MGGALPRPGASILGVLVLSAVILATPAGRRPFWSSDEARFALLAQDALDHGRWLVAELRGRHYLNKPQLFFWAVAVASVPFGRVTEVSAAIPALVSSVAGAAAGVAVGFTEGPAALRKLRPLLGTGLAFGVAAIVWLVPYQAWSQGSFGDQVLGGHYLTWYLLGAILPRLTALYAPLVSFLPWTLLAAAAPVWWRQSPDAGRRRVALWTATLWLLIAISGNYRSRYMLVVSPGLALLAAEFLTAQLAGRARRARNLASLVGGVFAVAAAGASALSPLTRLVGNEDRVYIPEAGWERVAIVALGLAACVVLVRGVRLGAPTTGAVGLALAMAGILLVEGITYPIRYTRAFDVRPLTVAAAANVAPGGTVVGYPGLRLSYDFYLQRRVVEIADDAAVRARLATAPHDAFIMTAERWRALAPAADSAWRVLASAPLADKTMV